MSKANLARQLRERQYDLGEVCRAMIDALPDDEIIDCYNTCACCRERQLTPTQVVVAIARAGDADHFLLLMGQMSRRH